MANYFSIEAMDISRLITWYDLLLTPNFLDEATCRQLIEEAQAVGSDPASVYGQGDGGQVNDRVRKAKRLKMGWTTTEFITQRLIDHKKTIEERFSIPLNKCEEPQFLSYDIGDFFVAHQDGNTGLIRLSSDAERRVSIVILLNSQSETHVPGTYSGGSLRFSDYRAEPQYSELHLPIEAGTLVAFRSERTHEVTPITHGHRYSIVSWYR
ncbi:MAG TPA: 2OG-Fe(II) oxygenase [Pyrinomonadaceae bacterium]|nr:2OG-Fe(II) oxygenase [Pyrinomonadaceae bacterium]